MKISIEALANTVINQLYNTTCQTVFAGGQERILCDYLRVIVLKTTRIGCITVIGNSFPEDMILLEFILKFICSKMQQWVLQKF